MQTDGDVGKTIASIQAARLRPFLDHIWQEEELSSDDEPQADDIHSRKKVPKKVKELVVKKNVNHDVSRNADFDVSANNQDSCC